MQKMPNSILLKVTKLKKDFPRQWITRESLGVTRRRENGVLIRCGDYRNLIAPMAYQKVLGCCQAQVKWRRDSSSWTDKEYFKLLALLGLVKSSESF